MKLSIVTSVYKLRKIRSLDFYLRPLNDFLKDMKESDIIVNVHTDLDFNLFENSSNFNFHSTSIDELINFFWDDKDWRDTYRKALIDRSSLRFEEKDIPELIGIWLGKFEMMFRASLNSDYVLWQDAGILSYLYGRKDENYKRYKCKPDKYKSGVKKIIKNSNFAFLSSDKNPEFYHGVKMSNYNNLNNYCRGGFILSRSENVLYLKNQIKFFWNLLLTNKDFGTEENPLTLFQWDNKDCVVLNYDSWLYQLGILNRRIFL